MNMYKKKTLYKLDAKPLACFSEIYYKGFIMQELENVAWKHSQFSNIGYCQMTTPTGHPASSSNNATAAASPRAGQDMTRTQSQASQITALRE